MQALSGLRMCLRRARRGHLICEPHRRGCQTERALPGGKSPETKKPVITWDMELASGLADEAAPQPGQQQQQIASAGAHHHGIHDRLAAFIRTKANNPRQVLLSDLVWSFLGSFSAIFILGTVRV